VGPLDEDFVIRVGDVAESILEGVAHQSFVGEDWNDKKTVELKARRWYASMEKSK
jgi:hypothetical protein